MARGLATTYQATSRRCYVWETSTTTTSKRRASACPIKQEKHSLPHAWRVFSSKLQAAQHSPNGRLMGRTVLPTVSLRKSRSRATSPRGRVSMNQVNGLTGTTDQPKPN